MRMICASVIIGLCACVEPPARPEKLSAAAQEAAAARRLAILAELTDSDAPAWAGEYYQGDGTGVNVTLLVAPRAGFVFEWDGCMGLYDLNFGDVHVSEGRLSLSFTFENCREGFQGVAPELVPVRWGERQYLLPADDVIGFCDEVNHGGEPRDQPHGFYLLRHGDEAKPVSGWPDVPVDFRDALLQEPVHATVLEAGDSTARAGAADIVFHDTPLMLDAGRLEGLRVGMSLYVTEPEGVYERVRIESVDDHRAVGILTRTWDPAFFQPQRGWRLSTRPPWRPEVEPAPATR